MKMVFNWQAIINFILFAMIVVAFTFAIWAYVKTNSTKNSNSPSVPSIINDNNTYVNNIASAPNLVTLNLGNEDRTYTPKATDNGSTILVTSNSGGPILKANFNIGVNRIRDDKNNIIEGYYINVTNGNFSGGENIEIYSNLLGTMILIYTLVPGESAYYYQRISDLIDPNINSSAWYSSV